MSIYYCFLAGTSVGCRFTFSAFRRLFFIALFILSVVVICNSANEILFCFFTWCFVVTLFFVSFARVWGGGDWLGQWEFSKIGCLHLPPPLPSLQCTLVINFLSITPAFLSPSSLLLLILFISVSLVVKAFWQIVYTILFIPFSIAAIIPAGKRSLLKKTHPLAEYLSFLGE